MKVLAKQKTKQLVEWIEETKKSPLPLGYPNPKEPQSSKRICKSENSKATEAL